MVGGVGNKIVATLDRTGQVFYPTQSQLRNSSAGTAITQFANLMNYKIRTEGEMANKSLSTIPTTVVDLGKQLLQYARDSDLKGVKNALSRGAPFTSDWLGMSALHFAAMNNQYEICKVLLASGINKDSKTKVDRTPLHLACYYGNIQIAELLISKSCAINPKDMLRMTPLHWAVEKRHKEIVRLLLKHNADVTGSTKFNRTALGIAVLTEQADILEELEAARQTQANRKYNELQEKETSEAVNSIMGLTTTNGNDEGEAANKVNQDGDEYTNQSDYAASKIADLENIKETGLIGSSTLNLLKSHGISMMPDDDTSKDMLNSALQNGRQLILSEVGKLLLNETKITNNNNNAKNAEHCNANSSAKTIMPARVHNDNPRQVSSLNNSNMNKLKPNVVSKAKDNQQIAKNKNIRIISLNDFKKLYGNTNLKAMQKLPSVVSNQQRLVNVRQPVQMQQQQVKVELQNNTNQQAAPQKVVTIEEDGSISELISNSFMEADTSPPQNQQSFIKLPQQQHSAMSQKPPVRVVPAKRAESMASVRTVSAAKSIKLTPNTQTNQDTQTGGTLPVTPVIPLLTMPEVCRQLLELRKQNEEIRRKFDLAQKEKEEMRQRIERLEELLLVERTDEEFTNS